MPRRLQSKSDQDIADLAVDLWLGADEQRKPRIAVWKKSYRDHDPQYIDKTKVTRDPKVKIPYAHRVLSTQVTTLLSATEANGRWLNAQPVTPDEGYSTRMRDRAEAVTEFLENQHRAKSSDVNLNNIAAEERVAQMGLKYGNSDFYPEFVRGNNWWAFRFNSMSPFDTWRDARHGRFYIVRRYPTISKLAQLANGLLKESSTRAEERSAQKALKVVRKLLRLAKEGKVVRFGERHMERDTDRRFEYDRVAGRSGTSDEDDEYRVRPQDDPWNVTVELLEVHETDRDGRLIQVVPDWGGDDNLVFRAEKNRYGACQIIPFAPHTVDNEFYGYGNGEVIGLLADAMNYNLRAALYAVGSQGSPPLLVSRHAGVKARDTRNLYGKVIRVRDPQRDFMWMPPNIGPGFHQIGQEIAKQAADFALGENDLRRGDASSSGSATAAAIGERFSNLTDQNIFRRWRDSTEQLGHVLVRMAAVHLTRTELIPILGRKTTHFLPLHPDDLKGEWFISFGGNPHGASSMQMFQMHSQIVERFGALGEIDVREAAREMYRLMGERDPDRFLTRKDDVEPVDPETENVMLMDGQSVQMSVRDDHHRHIQSHQQALRELVASIEADWGAGSAQFDHRVFGYQFHVMQHHQALQPAQGPGGGGGGAQPLQPQQAGQQGQPMSFQPGVSDLNERRQVSNQQAGGGAPGPPTVPDRRVGSIVNNGGPR